MLPNVRHQRPRASDARICAAAQSRGSLHAACSASWGSLALADFRGKEISIRSSFVGGKIPAPHFAGGRINDEPVIPCARNLITSDRVGRRYSSDAERDQNAEAQPNQCTLEIYFSVHKTLCCDNAPAHRRLANAVRLSTETPSRLSGSRFVLGFSIWCRLL
jgi:hypothetical protein